VSQAERAAALRRLHAAPGILVLVNVWDAASARTVAALPGCRALATASWSVAAALGVPDGEGIGRDAMLAAVRRVAGAVDVPLSADLERGYGDEADAVRATVAGAIAAGAVGCNLEDGTGDPADPLRPVAEHAARLAAARAAGEQAGVPLVINGRTDVYLAGWEGDRLAEAVARGRAYMEAGADCVFVPGVSDAETIAALVRGLGAPLSLLATPATPPPAELERLGVSRVSLGPGSLGVALAALERSAAALFGGEAFPPELGFRPPAR